MDSEIDLNHPDYYTDPYTMEWEGDYPKLWIEKRFVVGDIDDGHVWVRIRKKVVGTTESETHYWTVFWGAKLMQGWDSRARSYRTICMMKMIMSFICLKGWGSGDATKANG